MYTTNAVRKVNLYLSIFSTLFFQMPRKKQKLELESFAENPFDVKSLPNEVWCICFSYLDKKSLQNSTATCTHWFELIRNNSKFSGQICLPNDGLKELKRKIDDAQWIWTRWPVL